MKQDKSSLLYRDKVEKSSTMKSRDVYLYLAWREQSLNTGNAFNVQFMTKTGFILQLFYVAIRLDRGHHVYRCVANDRINIVMTF